MGQPINVCDNALVFFHCKADASYFRCINTLSLWEGMTPGPQSRKSEEEVTHIWISAGQSCPATAGVTWRHDRTLARPEPVSFTCVMKFLPCVCVFEVFFVFFFLEGVLTGD